LGGLCKAEWNIVVKEVRPPFYYSVEGSISNQQEALLSLLIYGTESLREYGSMSQFTLSRLLPEKGNVSNSRRFSIYSRERDYPSRLKTWEYIYYGRLN